MSKAIIQDREGGPAALNAAFWINIILGVLVAGLLVLCADWLARLIFKDARVARVLQVMAVQVLLAAASSIHAARLQRDMQFKALFWVRFLTVVAPIFLSIPLAWIGYGYWALVGGTITGQVVQLLVLWRISEWAPGLSFDIAVAFRLVRFGIWVTASGLLAWFYLWADSLIVSIYLGSHELGLYRTGSTFVVMVFGLLFTPMLPVLYSHLSRVQDDVERVARVLLRVVRVITFTSVPVGFLLYALADPLSRIIFGTQWHGVGTVIALLALAHGFAWIVGANAEAYRAVGRPDYETKATGFALVFYVVAYWLAVQEGFETFLWARLGSVAVGMAIQLWIARVALGLPVGSILLYTARVSLIGIPLVLIGHNAQLFGTTPATQLTFAAVAACSWSVLYLWLIERNALIPETVRLLRGSVGERP